MCAGILFASTSSPRDAHRGRGGHDGSLKTTSIEGTSLPTHIPVQEDLRIYDGVDQAIGAFGMSGNQGNSRPSAYLNYILFDKHYKLLDMGWTAVPESANMTKQKVSIPTVDITEPGYIFVYLTFESESNQWVYFDDFKVTHHKTRVIQYNEYYPYGLQASTSWTREGHKNNFLFNGGSELNVNTMWYETMFRGYDGALGRFLQVDPLAYKYSDWSPYSFSFDNPILWNDPLGAEPSFYDFLADLYENTTGNKTYSGAEIATMFSIWADDQGGGGGGGGLDWGSFGSNLFDVEISGGNGRPVTITYAYLDYSTANAHTAPTVVYAITMIMLQENSVVLDLDGNIIRFDPGANQIYVDMGGGDLEPLHTDLAKYGRMSLAAFSNALLSVTNGMSLPKGTKFDSRKLHNGKFSLAFDNGMTYNDGVYEGYHAQFNRVNGFIKVTYTHLNGPSLTVDTIRSILGVHEYYAHGVRGLTHPRDNATIASLVAGYPYD